MRGREGEREIDREKMIEGDTDRQTGRIQKKRNVRDKQGEHVKKEKKMLCSTFWRSVCVC